MKKLVTGSAILTLAAIGAFTLPSAASATQIDPNCTPVAAWVETIPGTDAFGDPTITVDNPDYVAPTYTPGYNNHVPATYTPAVGEPTITVDNPDYQPAVEEVTKVVHHDAITHTEWKYSKHGGQGFQWIDNDTYKYIDKHGNGTNDKPRYGTYYERTQNTREVTDTDAWDETVVVTPASPAVGEPTIIIDNPDYVAPVYVPAHDEWVEPVYTPAEGSKTIVIDNLDYVAATPASSVEHEAVVCDEIVVPPVEETPEPPAEKPAKADKVVKAAAAPTAPSEIQTAASGELAVTGASDALWGYTFGALGIGTVILGGVLLLGARKAE